MISKLLYFCIYVTLLSINIEGSYSLCGNWQTYRNEKCIKIFSTEKLVTFDEALNSCSQVDNSSQILTIHSKEEQDFLNEYLFKNQKLMENIWIGLRNKIKIFEWTDSSNNAYTNWKTGNPTNKTDYSCVQLEPDSLQWANEPCMRRGLVVCEKLPEITDLLKQIRQTEGDLKERQEIVIKTEANLRISEEKLKKLEEDFKKIKEDLRVNNDNLKESKTQWNETSNAIINMVYHNKNVSRYHFFTDINGKNKAFIIPFDGMRKQTFDDSVYLCKTFNSTLIEIESREKQLILESSLDRLGIAYQTDEYQSFWINGLRDSSGVWKWLNSKTTFTFTNWQLGFPVPDSNKNNALVYCSESRIEDEFGQWYNGGKNDIALVVCEHTF